MNWFRNLNLLPKLLLAGVASIVLIAAIEAVAVNTFYSKFHKASENRRLCFSIHISILKALRAQNNYFIQTLGLANVDAAAKSSTLQNFQHAMDRCDGLIQEMTTTTMEEDREDIEAMRNLAGSYRRAFLRVVEDMKNGATTQSGLKQTLSTELLQKLNHAADEIEMIADKRAERATSAADEARVQLEVVAIGLLALLLPIAVLLLYSIGTSISRPIKQLKDVALEVGKGNLATKIEATTKDEIGILANTLSEMTSNLLKLIEGVKRSGIHVTSSSTQIAAAARQLQATVSEQAASTNEVVATTKEISATSRELAKTMSAITEVSEKTRALAQAGQAGLADIGTTMRELVTATQSIMKRLAILSARASNINSIIIAIAKVADQTNLLSLNAAIEAEKAGEYGLGFGVVASEIRRLADQTGASTLEIERTVKEVQSAVADEVRGMEKFSEGVRNGAERIQSISSQIGTIIEQVQTLSPRFEAVSEGMQSQSLGADQIAESMIQLSEAAQQTAQAVREFNNITDSLNAAARTLHEEVSVFRIAT